jgi:predicted metal-dependent phosphoesterase TrpH
VVPGVEIGATWRMTEVHILGYGCRAADPDLAAALAAMRESRERRFERMLARLAQLGLPLEASAVERIADGAVLGRPHVAQAMVDRGYVASVAAAFAQYIGDGRPAYVDRLRLSCEQAMALIRGAGGVSVLAHPGLIGSDNAVHSLIARGISGLEVHYPQHDATATAHYASLARRFGLLITGGSDFHGIPGEGGAIGECGVSETELVALAGAAGIAADTHV